MIMKEKKKEKRGRRRNVEAARPWEHKHNYDTSGTCDAALLLSHKL